MRQFKYHSVCGHVYHCVSLCTHTRMHTPTPQLKYLGGLKHKNKLSQIHDMTILLQQRGSTNHHHLGIQASEEALVITFMNWGKGPKEQQILIWHFKLVPSSTTCGFASRFIGQLNHMAHPSSRGQRCVILSCIISVSYMYLIQWFSKC